MDRSIGQQANNSSMHFMRITVLLHKGCSIIYMQTYSGYDMNTICPCVEVRGSKELEVLLNYDCNGSPSDAGETMNLSRLKLAIKYKQKRVRFFRLLLAYLSLLFRASVRLALSSKGHSHETNAHAFWFDSAKNNIYKIFSIHFITMLLTTKSCLNDVSLLTIAFIIYA